VHGAYRNLGLWTPGETDYARAARALAHRVGSAAELAQGARVLELGCGSGAALALWRQAFGASRVVGLEPDQGQFEAARGYADEPKVTVLNQQASAAAELGLGSFDAVLAVDAAYHFDAERWVDAAGQVLAPGGWLAFTDFVAEPDLGARRGLLNGAARLCRFGPGAPMSWSTLTHRLRRAGLALAGAEDLSASVLDGFAGWVASGAAAGPDVSGLALKVSARLCRTVRRAKVARYMLVRAYRPH